MPTVFKSEDNAMIIIGLLGRAYSGKSTIADHLFKHHGFRVFSFARPIKELAIVYFNVSFEEANETKPPHVRTILQGIDSLIREAIDVNYFISEMAMRIKYSEADKIVIDDVRLPEEAAFIKDLGGIVVKIECPDGPRALTGQAQAHITEQIDQIPYDYLIAAEYGNVAKLVEEIEGILEGKNVPLEIQEGHEEWLSAGLTTLRPTKRGKI